MQKISGFLIKKRYLFLAVMTALTIVAAFFAVGKNINGSRTDWLTSDSQMRRGIEIMEHEFPEDEVKIWDGGDSEAYPAVPDFAVALVIIAVSSVAALVTRRSLPAVLSIFITGIGASLLSRGTDVFYSGIWKDNSYTEAVMIPLIAVFFGFVFCDGFNREFNGENGMKSAEAALRHSLGVYVPCIACSFALVPALFFVNHRGALQMGLILAKGTLLAALFAAAVIPVLMILLCKKPVKAAVKENKEVSGPAKDIAGAGRVFLIAFIVIFLLSAILQHFVNVSFAGEYPASEEDGSKTDITCLVYQNEEEGRMGAVIDSLLEDPHVTEISGYSNTLGKMYSAEELTKRLNEMNDELDMSEGLMKLLYYNYFDGGVRSMDAASFFEVLGTDILNDDSFSAGLDERLLRNRDIFKNFADRRAIQEPMNLKDLSAFCAMPEGKIERFFLKYMMKNGNPDRGTMNINEFMKYVTEEIAKDDYLGTIVGGDVVSGMKRDQTFFNEEEMNTERHYREIASLLGIDEDLVKDIFIYYKSSQGDIDPGMVTLGDFIAYVKRDGGTSSLPRTFVSQDTINAIAALEYISTREAIQKKMTPEELADTLNLNRDIVSNIFELYYPPKVDNKKMSVSAFFDYVMGYLFSDSIKGGYFDDSVRAQIYSKYEEATFEPEPEPTPEPEPEPTPEPEPEPTPEPTPDPGDDGGNDDGGGDEGGTGEDISDQIETMSYSAGAGTEEIPKASLSVSDDPGTVMNVSTAIQDELQPESEVKRLYHSGDEIGYRDMADVMGISESIAKDIYMFYTGSELSGKTMTMKEFYSYINSNERAGSLIDSDTMNRLAGIDALADRVLSGTRFSPEDLSGITGVDAATLRYIYICRNAGSGNFNQWKMSLKGFMDFVNGLGDRIAGSVGSETMARISRGSMLTGLAASGEALTPERAASLFGIDGTGAEKLFLVYRIRHGDSEDMKITPENFINYLVHEGLSDTELLRGIGDDMKQDLSGTKPIMDAVLTGKTCSAVEMTSLINSLSGETDRNDVELMYLYYSGLRNSEPGWAMSIFDMFTYLSDNLMNDKRFRPLFDQETINDMPALKEAVDQAVKRLVGEHYSRLIIKTDFRDGEDGERAFVSKIAGIQNHDLEYMSYRVGKLVLADEFRKGHLKEVIAYSALTLILLLAALMLTLRRIKRSLIIGAMALCSTFCGMLLTAVWKYPVTYPSVFIAGSISVLTAVMILIAVQSAYSGKNGLAAEEAAGAAFPVFTKTVLTWGLVSVVTMIAAGAVFPVRIVRNVFLGSAQSAAFAIIFGMIFLPAVLSIKKKKKEQNELHNL